MAIRGYRDLEVWQKAMDMAVACHQLAACFPANEQYGLASQLRRAAVSVPANIAEGKGRRGKREFIRFLLIAHGSLAEVETHLELAKRLGYAKPSRAEELQDQAAEVGRMINGLVKALKTRSNSDPRAPTPKP